MPNYVSRLRISNKIPAVDKQRFTIVTRLLGHDTKAGSLRISVAAFAQCPGSLMPVAECETVTFRSIASSDAGDSASSLPASYYWDLIPSLDFAGDEGLAKVVAVDPLDEHELARRRQLNSAAVYYMDRALKETAGDDFSQLPSHLFSYLNWARRVVAREDLAFVGEPLLLLAEVSNCDAQGEMLCALGEQLVPILRGEVQPLEIMLKDGLLSRHYEQEKATARGSRVLARCVRHLSDVKPDLRVLEIGAGTGSATLPVLQELSRGAEELPAFLSYTFTDISSGFFENARTKLAKWSQCITYKKLDISQDPVQQGFAAEQYDVVIASNVLHATPNIAATLDHVRTVLKPNGKLLLLEGVCHPPLSLPFALLPGWWLSEDEYRSHEEGPLLSEETWQRLLSARGFSGVDGAIADYPGSPEHIISVMCSTRIGIQEDCHNTGSITICGPIKDNDEEEFAQMVSDHVTQRLGCPLSVKPLSEIDAADDPFCIFIDSPRHSILGNVSSDSFKALKNTLLETTGVLWVVPENRPPEAETIKGMLRTLRLETESKHLLMLENTPCTSQGALAIAQVAERLRHPELAGNVDQDFVWHKGMIHLPRFRQLTGAKEAFASEAGVPVRKVQNIWKGDDSLEMTVDAAGSPHSIYFRRTDVQAQSLGDDEVLVRVEAAGVNFRDLLLVLGSIPWTTPGFDGAGVVLRTGSCVAGLRPGDRVFYGSLGGGGFATYVRMPCWRACKIPDGISSADAASISVAYSTAITAIMCIARLRKGESVLIHAASGAVGQACIVLAQHLGARIFATAGTPMKREFLYETFGIPKAHIFSSRTLSSEMEFSAQQTAKGST
jgi:SAM-dependent methyltransferase